MHKFTKIYLDMDGVISDFYKRFRELFGSVPEKHKKDKKFYSDFDVFVKDKNFATLDLMPDARELLNYLKTIEVPIEILSSTATKDQHNAISYQKEIWLKKHHINYPGIFVPGKDLKKKFADEYSIIIDDTESVIDDWRKAGGTAIHHTDAAITIAILNTLLSV